MEAPPSSFGITLVVPTFNNSGYLSNLLLSYDNYYQAGKVGEGDIELLIIDDSNPKETAIIQSLCCHYKVRYLRCEGNVSKKRNYGVTQASHEIILFTDSDCELTSTSITGHLKLYKTDPDINAVCGVVEFSGKNNWVWSVVQRTGFLGCFSFAKIMPYVQWGVTANLSVKKNALQKIGGFDETFLKAPGGEDVDFGLRLNKAGYRIISCPNAIIYHTKNTWNTFGRMIKRVFSYGRSHYHIITKHGDKVGHEYPRRAVVFLLVSLLVILKLFILHKWIHLVEIPIFFLSVLLTEAILVLGKGNFKLKTIIKEVLAYIIDLTFEYGLMFESVSKLDTRGFWAKMIYSEKQLVHERNRKIIQCWALVIGFLILILMG